MKVAIYYHRVDWDGIFSALIAREFLEKKGLSVELEGWTYGDEVPGVTDILGKYSSIYMVDISFPSEVMLGLHESSRVTWIDHHQTSIKDSELSGYSKMAGLRRDGLAACELTWEYLHPGKECPMIIQYLGAYDVWSKDRFLWDDLVLPLQYGLKSEYNLSVKKVWEDWKDLMSDSDLLDYLIDQGKGILNWLSGASKSWVKIYGIPVTVAGKYKAIALLTPLFGSISFESVLEEYDLYITLNIREGTHVIGLYAEPDRLPEFSAGEYLKMICLPGAGGHRAAAGGTLSKEKFLEVLYEGKL